MLLSSLSISGCSTTGKGLSNDALLTTAEGTLAGLAAGWLAGGDTKKLLVGAAVGTGIGAVVASTKDTYKNQEDAIDKEISNLNEVLHRLKSVNKSLKKQIETYRKHIAALKTQLRQDASKQTDLDRQKVVITEKQADIQKTIESLGGEMTASQESYEKMKASIKTKTEKAHLKVWQDKIAVLKKEKAQLEQHSGQLQAISNSLGS
jgi:chromosome segregation ATPase